MLPALDCLLASSASSVMGCALHGDFALRKTITPAVLDVRMHLIPFLTSMSVPGCTTFVSFWRHATILPPKNHLLHDLITRLFLRSLPYGIVVLGFHDAFVYAHHERCLDSANAGNFGDCLTGRVRFMTAITPAFAHAYRTVCLCDTPSWRPTPHLPTSQAQVQVSISSQCTFHHKKLAMIIRCGLSMLMVVSVLWMVKPFLDGVWFPDPLMGEYTSCLVLSSPPRLISLSLVPDFTPTTPLK